MIKSGGRTIGPGTGWRRSLEGLQQEVIGAPLEPILHPSSRRLWWLGLSIMLGNALFAWIWSVWLPQPYENLTLRVVASLLGYSLMTPFINREPASNLAARVFGVLFWLELPVFFTWMYLCNSGSAVWLATLSAMVLIYYLVTDWRLATIGTVSGAFVAVVLFEAVGPDVPRMPAGQMPVHAVVFTFAWLSALVLNLSSANLRREQLASTLATMGIMAHELRTPLSTAALLGDAILLEADRVPDQPVATQLDKLAKRLHGLVRNMNHQIDAQIANAKLLQLPRQLELVRASEVVRNTVLAYPFPTSRQRECVRVVIHSDFVFRSSYIQFSQVLDNLIKNALHSLTAADSRFALGALRLEVGLLKDWGRIVVTDDGMGIDAALLPHIFKPFFSSNRGTGHGLGLAFCERVVRAADGSISVKSEFAIGATFTIELPSAKLQPDDSTEKMDLI